MSYAESYTPFYGCKRRHSGIDYMTSHQKHTERKKLFKIFLALTDYNTID